MPEKLRRFGYDASDPADSLVVTKLEDQSPEVRAKFEAMQRRLQEMIRVTNEGGQL